MNKKIALENLVELHEIFKTLNVEYWLSCGTLLGFYRDNDFIGHDKDTDVCINIDCLSKYLIQKLISAGFLIKHKFGRIHNGFEIAIVKNNVKTDLFFFYKKENYWYHSVYANFTKKDSLKYDYVFNPFELKENKFLNHFFVTPDDIESVLIQQYGTNWKTPNKNWIYYQSPLNLIKTQKRIKNCDTLKDFEDLLKDS